MVTKKKAAPSRKAATKPDKMVLVTTAHRGVFVGLLEQDNAPASLVLQKVRNVIQWRLPGKGFLALASDGPSPSCMIGRVAERTTLYDVTSITEISPEARKVWDARQ